MKRISAAFLVLLWIVCLLGCGKDRGGKLTMEDVRSMAAEQGEALTWSDFERYSGTETGSGLYILVYEVDESYQLMIGGTPDEKPMYIYLVSKEDADRRIDIRYDDIETFLNRTE